MAKAKGVSIFEQHVEKGVLLICLLILGYTIHHWVLSSPRAVNAVRPTGRGVVSLQPAEADGKLLGAASEIERRVEEIPPNTPPLPKWPEIARARQNEPFARLEPLAHLSSGARPIHTLPPSEPPKPPTLAEMEGMLPAPGAPLVQAEPMLCKEAVGKDASHDIVGACVVATYPVGEVRTKWQDRLRQTPIKPIIIPLAVQAELFERNPDGSWPKSGRLVAAAANIPKPPAPIPAYDGKNAADVRKAIEAFGDSKVRKTILQPGFWDVWKDGAWTDWKAHMPATKLRDQPFDEQWAGDRVLVWLHDPDLVKTRQYRYRARLRLVNPLLTYEADLGGSARARGDARVAFVDTPWSEVSRTFSVPKVTKFFLVGYGMTASGRVARVKVYAQTLGQWVWRAFNVSPGQRIGSLATVKGVKHPATGKAETVTVDFDTGAVGLEFDFNRPFYRSSFSRPQKTTEMIYLDGRGRLGSRIRVVDERRLRAWEKSLEPTEQPKTAGRATP